MQLIQRNKSRSDVSSIELFQKYKSCRVINSSQCDYALFTAQFPNTREEDQFIKWNYYNCSNGRRKRTALLCIFRRKKDVENLSSYSVTWQGGEADVKEKCTNDLHARTHEIKRYYLFPCTVLPPSIHPTNNTTATALPGIHSFIWECFLFLVKVLIPTYEMAWLYILQTYEACVLVVVA